MKKLFSLALLGVAARWLADRDRRDVVLARVRGLAGRVPTDAVHSATAVARDAADRATAAANEALGRDTDAATADDPATYAGGPDDARLTDKVESELFRGDDVPKGSINVNVEFGKVVLRGEVESRELIDDLVVRTRAIEGVNDVESLLHLPGEPAPMHEVGVVVLVERPRVGSLDLPPQEQLGAVPVADDAVALTVWAPAARELAVRANGADHPLAREDELWRGTFPARVGDEYWLVLDGEQVADPWSRAQPHGLRGPSAVQDTSAYDTGHSGIAREHLVIYELHVGTFTPEGTFDAAATRLRELAELGVTAVELMPIATFPGDRNWGYDGVFTSAPHPVYGGPDGFARFVAAAHEAGVGVLLDVVYNHVGPGHRLHDFGPWFTDRHDTPWGDALDYAQPFVREWAIQNAELWIRDYGVDGLRLDAVHAIHDDSPTHVLRELADRVRAINPRALVISEIETGDERPIRAWGHDAQWADEVHHELHVLLTGERDGYYADYGSVDGLARQLERQPADRFVVCGQNHDQVGNRALGDRPDEDELVVRAAAVLLAPQVPLLFMGEEYGERRPFQFFTDHDDPFIADATREGRRREFERFAQFAGEDVPDPQDRATFERSKLDPARGSSELWGFYADLIRLRRELPREVTAEVEGRTLRLRRGDFVAEIDFDAREVDVSHAA